MFESFELRNFQSHHRLSIEFDPRVTVIIGDSDIGKSAFIRALKWTCLNQFEGPADSFIRWGQETAKGILRVDGREIVREKGKHNAYDLDSKELKSFGSGKVPEEIANLLRLTEQNFQGQLDPHFWFNATPGQVSRELNQIINLGSIDSALSHVTTTVRKARAVVDVTSSRLKDAAEAVNTMQWVDDAHDRMAELDSLQDDIHENARQRELLHTLISKGKQAKEVAENAVSCIETGTRASEIATRLSDGITHADRLQSLLLNIEATRKKARVELPELPNPSALFENQTKLKRLRSILDAITDEEDELCHLKSQIKEVEKVMPSQCPICQTTMKSERS